MANKKAKKKNILKIRQQTIRNRAIKSRVKTAFKNARKAILNKDKDVKVLVAKAHSEIERAVSKKVFHKKNASRKVSNLYSLMNKTNNPK